MPLAPHHHTAGPALALAGHCGSGEHSPHPAPTEQTPWRRASPQSPVTPGPRREALLLDGEQLLGARVLLPSGCDPVSSEALSSERRTLQEPPGPLPRLTRGAPRWKVGGSGRRPCPHLWDSLATGVMDTGPWTKGLLGTCLPSRPLPQCCGNRARLGWKAGVRGPRCGVLGAREDWG